jgi:hexosaminidase
MSRSIVVATYILCFVAEVAANGHLGPPLKLERHGHQAAASFLEGASRRNQKVLVGSDTSVEPFADLPRLFSNERVFDGDRVTRRIRRSTHAGSSDGLLPLVPYPAHAERLGGSWELQLPIPVRVDSDEAGKSFFTSALTAMKDVVEVSEQNEHTNPNGVHLVKDSHVDGGEEAYVLIAKPGAPLQIRAKGAAGLFYGVQTLLQLLPENTQQARLTLPSVEIKDEPRFGYRGMMVDTGRHFFKPEDLKRLIATMASQKYNRLHWHITDDQGWRLPVEKWPKLVEAGSGLLEADSNPSGIAARPEKPYYSLDEIKDVVEYAAQKHIEVIPEIDLPGHMTPALVAYPELGNDDIPGWQAPKKLPMEHFKGEKVWGVYDQTLQPSKKALQFVEDVVETVVQAFPSRYVHIGGDEAPSKEWDSSPRAQSLVQDEGLQSTQSFFTKAVSKILEREGKIPMAWDEVLGTGGAPDDMVITAWRSSNELHKALRRGKAVSSVSDFLYLDRYQEHSPGEPPAQPGFVPLQKVYSYDPAVGLTNAQSKNLLGVQGQLWSEYLPDFKQLEYMAHPRSYALAEVAWSPRGRSASGGGYAGFIERLNKRLPDLSRRGVNYHAVTAASSFRQW